MWKNIQSFSLAAVFRLVVSTSFDGHMLAQNVSIHQQLINNRVDRGEHKRDLTYLKEE